MLPPWGRIGYHWRERNMEQSKIPWSKFFDTEQFSRYVPTLELTDYFEEIGEEKVEEIWVGCSLGNSEVSNDPSEEPFLNTLKVPSKL